MTQPANFGVPRSGPASPTTMAERMDDSLDALLSLHRGTSRPSYAVAGTLWIDDSAGDVWAIKVFDGSNSDAVLAWFDSSEPGITIGNIVGTVSQSGGIPTGAIVERGSGPGGHYTRFADGTQICWTTITLSFNNNNNIQADWDFEVAFSSLPEVSATGGGAGSAAPNNTHLGPLMLPSRTTTSALIRQFRIDDTIDFEPGDEMDVSAIAIGFWHE